MNSEAVLQLAKQDHNPITSTLLSMLYLSGAALTVGAAGYKWSGKKFTLTMLF